MQSDRVEDFFSFINRRHRAFLNRFDDTFETSLWTPDPYIVNYHYTNVYRELDRGTVYYIQFIAKDESEEGDKKLFATLVYRLFNKIETFEMLVKGLHDGWSKDMALS